MKPKSKIVYEPSRADLEVAEMIRHHDLTDEQRKVLNIMVANKECINAEQVCLFKDAIVKAIETYEAYQLMDLKPGGWIVSQTAIDHMRSTWESIQKKLARHLQHIDEEAGE